MREIVLDTETTGFNSKGADRLVEVACLEIVNKKVTGNTFHTYINPRREIPQAATKVHNITTAFVQDKPFFESIAKDFLSFIDESPLVIHNAPFDMGFLNAELARYEFNLIANTRAIDTLSLARQKFPGANNTLDGLCKRFKIDLSSREFHGALIDCELLAQVYVELLGGRQKAFSFGGDSSKNASYGTTTQKLRQQIPSRNYKVSDEDEANHQELISSLKEPLWRKSS